MIIYLFKTLKWIYLYVLKWMIKISHYLSCINMYILLINALIIYIGLQLVNPDTSAEHRRGDDSNVGHSTQGIYFLFKFWFLIY